ncbi:MAG: glycosyltransferase [Patescibacteria group bacterium]
MKILHIVPTYFPAHRQGGPIKSVHELNKGLVKLGTDITVYTTNMDASGFLNVPLNQEVNVDGVKVFYFPITFRLWQYSFAMKKALAKNVENFDLIHITSVFLAVSTLGTYYAKRFNKPYVISPRGSFMLEPLKFSFLRKKIYINLIEKINLAGADAIHFTVEKEKEDYLKLRLPLKKAMIIPNSIDVGDKKKIVSGSFRKKFKISDSAKIVLFMGRLHKIKGLDILISAFSEIVKKEPNLVLVLAGPDDEGYGKNLKSQILNLKIDDKVLFTGMLIGDDKIAAYRESDVFVLPSYSENFGMSVVEAMAIGLPVVITKGVGISPNVERVGAGIVIKKDEKQLTAAILKILNNSELAKKMGGNGRKLVETEFSSDKVAKKFIKEYNEMIANYESPN